MSAKFEAARRKSIQRFFQLSVSFKWTLENPCDAGIDESGDTGVAKSLVKLSTPEELPVDAVAAQIVSLKEHSSSACWIVWWNLNFPSVARYHHHIINIYSSLYIFCQCNRTLQPLFPSSGLYTNILWKKPALKNQANMIDFAKGIIIIYLLYIYYR